MTDASRSALPLTIALPLLAAVGVGVALSYPASRSTADGVGRDAASSAAAAAPTTPSDSPAPPPRDPDAVAAAEVVQRSGSACIVRADAAVGLPRDVDERIRKAGGAGNWVFRGELFAGGREAAVRAFASELVAEGRNVFWIWVPDSSGAAAAREVRALTTPEGQTVWLAIDLIRSTPCPSS